MLYRGITILVYNPAISLGDNKFFEVFAICIEYFLLMLGNEI
jgi:hypothetical protein